MREIKFRIWDTEDKRWTVYEDVAWLQLVGRNRLKLKTKKGIVCEYTGLKDKNGKEIYEGDIVRTDEAGWIAKVIWNDASFMCVDNKGGFSADCWWERYEVLGNIYENPELLKEGKNGQRKIKGAVGRD